MTSSDTGTTYDTTGIASTTTRAISTTNGGATTDRSSSSDSRRKPEYDVGTIIDGKWKILSELGRGGCGIVYCVERCDGFKTPHPKAALKAEYVLKHYSETLSAEANILRKLQWSRHVCELHAYGRLSSNVNIICMSLAGPSLSYLRRHSPQQRMTFSTGLRIAYHCLNAIEDLHCIGYIHRDVKASNFAVGYYASEARIVRILDFGFARAYLAWNSSKTYLKPRRPRHRAPFLGTDRYCSINVHRRLEQGRRDDCWSWLFMLVELLYGKLPWRDVPRKKICQVKEDSLNTLFQHGPIEMYSAIDHLQALKYESRPDYDLLRRYIADICFKRGFKFTDPYDWEKGGDFYENFEKLKNSPSSRREVTTTASNISPQSVSQAVEKFEKPTLDNFTEALEQQPSPPVEKFNDLYIDPDAEVPKPSKPQDDVYEDAKDDTKHT